jgi:hypothetical protein
MIMCKQHSAKITITLGAGSIDSPYFAMAKIEQVLCSPVSIGNVPIFAPTFTVLGFETVGPGEYEATIQVEGVVYSTPCGGNQCATRPQTIKQTFPFAFVSTTAPTSVTITAGVVVNSLVASACQSLSREFVSVIPLNITVA